MCGSKGAWRGNHGRNHHRAGAVVNPINVMLTAEEHCRPHLAAYKLPRSVRFVPDLPKTSTGKVMRRELKTLDG